MGWMALQTKTHAPSRTIAVWVTVALSAFLVFASWAFASPVGSSPDDDFHLASIYCAGVESELCQDSSQLGAKQVAFSLLKANCFAQQEEVSAACQNDLGIFSNTELVETTRGNFWGQYPGTFYTAMNLLAGKDIQSSVISMRLFNSLIFVLLFSALLIGSSPKLRGRMGLLWLVTLVPLGLFIIPSTNPSSWAVMGVGTAFLSLFASQSAVGWRKVLLNVLYAVSVVLAAGARSDAAAFIILATGAALALQRPWKKLLSWWSVVPALGVVIAGISFIRAGQTVVLDTGFSTSGAAPTHGAVEIFFGNILNIPSLWLGVFGSWGLGWLDTQMPAIVWCGASAVFVALMFTSLKKASTSEYWVAGIIFAALAAIPIYVLQKSLVPVGAEVQPRYILPLLILLGAVVLVAFTGEEIKLSRVQAGVAAALLVIAQSIALYINLRRYVSGGLGGPILDLSPEWWWTMPIGPMWVWAIGSLAFAVCVAAVFSRFIAIPSRAQV